MSIRTINSLLAALAFLCTSSFAAPIPQVLPPLTVDVAGAQSFGALGTPGNSVLTVNVGANTVIRAFSYNVTLSAFAPSWLSEIQVYFSDSSQNTGIILAPSADEFSGTNTYAGSFDLVALGGDFSVLADGILRLEFYESFGDAPLNVVDGQWLAGNLSFSMTAAPVAGVPEPATYALMAIGIVLLYCNRRRRRSM